MNEIDKAIILIFILNKKADIKKPIKNTSGYDQRAHDLFPNGTKLMCENLKISAKVERISPIIKPAIGNKNILIFVILLSYAPQNI
jgi:hypothetical protein